MAGKGIENESPIAWDAVCPLQASGGLGFILEKAALTKLLLDCPESNATSSWGR